MRSLSKFLKKWFTTRRRSRKLPESLEDVPAITVKGRWETRYREEGGSLLVSGVLEDEARNVFLMFNGRLLGAAEPLQGKFRFLVQKAGRKFAPGAEFQLVTEAGRVQHVSGVTSWPVFDYLISTSDKFLDLDACIAKGMRLTKKGTLVPRVVPVKKKERYARLVGELEKWFEENRRCPLLVSHGTLLGIYRDGDLVPYDDDFDCLYLSRHSSIPAVCAERLEIAMGLVRAGFQCRLGNTGHIKVRNEYVEVDLMPAWIENDVLYVSSYSEIPGASRFVEPPSRLKWAKYGVFKTFARPRSFLEGQYGSNWRQPDPGYRVPLSRNKQRIRKQLFPPLEDRAALKAVRLECETPPVSDSSMIIVAK